MINFHKKNLSTDIIVPSLKIKHSQNENIVKVIKDKNKNVLYFSRSSIPYNFQKKIPNLQKHLSLSLSNQRLSKPMQDLNKPF